MTGTDLELNRELWAWRGLTLILILMLLITTVVSDINDRSRHAQENKERAEAWTKILANQGELKSMVSANYYLLLTIDEAMRQYILNANVTSKDVAAKLAIRNKDLDRATELRDEAQAVRDRKGKK